MARIRILPLDVEIEAGEDDEGEVKKQAAAKAGKTKEKSQMVEDESPELQVGQTVTIVGPRQEAVVKAVHGDDVDVAVGDQTFSVKAYEVMPS